MSQIDLTKKKVEVKNAPDLKEQQQKERTMVRGIFRFHEVPKGELSFNFRKYKEDPLETFTLKDGEVYTIPLGVAKHLNTYGWYPSYNFKNDEAGRPVVTMAERIRRCSFQSLEFVELDATGSALPK